MLESIACYIICIQLCKYTALLASRVTRNMAFGRDSVTTLKINPSVAKDGAKVEGALKLIQKHPNTCYTALAVEEVTHTNTHTHTHTH